MESKVIQEKKVIIVGAGIGGLCTAIRLQHKGYNVEIYEKNSFSGGCIHYISSNDGRFKIDECASIVINPLTYEEIFKDIGEDPRDYFQMVPLEDYYRVFYEDGTVLNLRSNMVETQESIKKVCREDVEGYTRFIFDTSLKYLKAKENLLNRAFILKREIYNFKTIKTIAELRTLTSADTYVKIYVKSPKLQQLILFQTFFMGVSPYRIPNIYTSIAANTQIEGIGHIKGGLSRYASVLEKLFLKLGGKIHYNCRIQRVISSSKIVHGIQCNGKFIEGDKVVINSDYINSQIRLLKRKHLKGIKNTYIDLSCSTFIIHLGFNKIFKGLQVHNLYLNKDFEEEINNVFQGKLPEMPSLYIYYPSVIDKSFCEDELHSVMNIMVRVSNVQSSNISWDKKTENMIYECCVKILQKILGIRDLGSYILYRSFTSPRDFQRNYEYFAGSCFGIGHTFLQSLLFRPQIRDKKFSNLYYVGSSIHPGNGASIVMDCAKIAAEIIDKS